VISLAEVKLEEFLRVVGEIFPNQKNVEEGEHQYDEYLGHREVWDDFTSIDEDKVLTVVLQFLNKWQCRLPYKYASELTEAIRKVEPLLKPLRNLSIEDADLLASVNVEGKTIKVLELIEQVFSIVQRVKAGRRTVGFTATSKILHMAIPTFFVMCDEKIRKAYGCEGNAAGYGNFMLRMNILARDLLTQAKGNKEIILSCSKWKGRTLARLLDNFNYTKFTRKKA
jgi:hypothetical protein